MRSASAAAYGSDLRTGRDAADPLVHFEHAISVRIEVLEETADQRVIAQCRERLVLRRQVLTSDVHRRARLQDRTIRVREEDCLECLTLGPGKLGLLNGDLYSRDLRWRA